MFKLKKWLRYILPALAVGIVALFAYGIYHTVYAYSSIRQYDSFNCALISDISGSTICPISGTFCNPLGCSGCTGCTAQQNDQQLETVSLSITQDGLVD
jgi:hypothetical protein